MASFVLLSTVEVRSMQAPLEIKFHNLKSTEWIDADIRRRVAKLATYCRDIISCRVIVEIPHRHRLHGNRFQVRVDLGVPGEDIVVSHAPRLRATERRLEAPAATKRTEVDATRKDARVVLREVFDKARRELQDYARRRRGGGETHPRPGRRVV